MTDFVKDQIDIIEQQMNCVHDWSDWIKLSSREDIRVCDLCSFTERRPHVVQIGEVMDVFEGVCSRCNDLKFVLKIHGIPDDILICRECLYREAFL